MGYSFEDFSRKSQIFFFFNGIWISDFLQREFIYQLEKELEFHETKSGGRSFHPFYPLNAGKKYILDWEIVECNTPIGKIRTAVVNVSVE